MDETVSTIRHTLCCAVLSRRGMWRASDGRSTCKRQALKSGTPMEWLLVLLIVVPTIIALVIWDIQSKDTPKQASPAIPSSGATRALLTGLAGLTLLGWGLFVYAKLDEADNQRGARREILALSANEEVLRNQVAQLDQSAGSLTDLQSRIAQETSRYNQATATHEQAQGLLASVQNDLEAQRQQLAQASQQLQNL